MDLLAQPTLGADAKAVANDQHPDQQGWIDGGSPGMAVVRRQVLVQLTQVQELVYAAEKVVCRDVVFEVEGVEQGRLPGFLTSHHRCDFRWIDGKSVDQLQPVDSTEFFNGIGR